MRQLWRNAADLFWRHPILWLPLLAADLLGFCLTQCQRLMAREIVGSLVQNHSVLGNTPEYGAQPATMMKAALLTAPFVWGTYFLNICLYTSAFLVTATLVDTFLQAQHPNLGSAVSSIKTRLVDIFIFSLKLLALYALAAILTMPVFSLIQKIHETKFLTTPAFPIIFALLFTACIAWFITPAGIALLRSPGSQPTTSVIRRQGRSFAILTVVASTAIAAFAQTAERSLLANSTQTQAITLRAIEAIASLLTAFPYIFLFIALPLLVTSKIEYPELQTAEPK